MEFKDRIPANGKAGMKLIQRMGADGETIIESFNAKIINDDGATEDNQGTELKAELFQNIYDLASEAKNDSIIAKSKAETALTASDTALQTANQALSAAAGAPGSAIISNASGIVNGATGIVTGGAVNDFVSTEINTRAKLISSSILWKIPNTTDGVKHYLLRYTDSNTSTPIIICLSNNVDEVFVSGFWIELFVKVEPYAWTDYLSMYLSGRVYSNRKISTFDTSINNYLDTEFVLAISSLMYGPAFQVYEII